MKYGMDWIDALNLIAKVYGWETVLRLWYETRGFNAVELSAVIAKYEKLNTIRQDDIDMSFKALKNYKNSSEILKVIESEVNCVEICNRPSDKSDLKYGESRYATPPIDKIEKIGQELQDETDFD